MPAVRVVMNGPAAVVEPAHRKVSITGRAGTLTFDIADPKVTFDDLADEWTETGRPGAVPLLERVGPRLAKLRLRAIFGTGKELGHDGRPRDVAMILAVLTTLARPIGPDETIRLAYSAWESSAVLTRSGTWVITEANVVSKRRRQGDNAITRAEVELTLTEASRIGAAPQPTAAGGLAKRIGPLPSSGTTTARPSSSPRRYTIAAGDTLFAIATRIYGDGNRWTAIADANKIKDPRRLTVGASLTLP